MGQAKKNKELFDNKEKDRKESYYKRLKVIERYYKFKKYITTKG
jgi:hypothetical protein